MKSMKFLTIGASAVAIAGLFLATGGASANPVYRPYNHHVAPVDPNSPLPHVGPVQGPYHTKNPASGTWTDYAGTLPFVDGPWNPIVLTDGTVLVEDFCTQPDQWYKLTPSKKGSYAKGKWSKIATMPAGYSPLFFASQILTDGRLIVNGGEYNANSNQNCGGGVWTTKGALYDPVKDSWSSVSPPTGWAQIGDAQSIVLPDGSYMLADCCANKSAIASISGTTVTWTLGTTYGDNDEEPWVALPNGNVLTVDVWNLPSSKDDYEIYDTTKGTWSLAGQTADLLTTTNYRELGPSPLTPQGPKGGTIVQCSANPTSGFNDIYSVANDKWTTGPYMKVNGSVYNCSDAPGATLPSGNVLIQASPGTFSTPSHFWEFSVDSTGTVTNTQVNDPSSAPSTSSFEGNLTLLPNGTVMWDNSQVTPNEVAFYKPKGHPKSSWLPVVSSVSSTLSVGSKGNAISGTNFNGFDLGGVYGDDSQVSTNFPIVRITNNSTGDVCYTDSYDFSTMGVWTKGTTNATFDIPSKCETGASSLQVIVNGIASAGTSVTLK